VRRRSIRGGPLRRPSYLELITNISKRGQGRGEEGITYELVSVNPYPLISGTHTKEMNLVSLPIGPAPLKQALNLSSISCFTPLNTNSSIFPGPGTFKSQSQAFDHNAAQNTFLFTKFCLETLASIPFLMVSQIAGMPIRMLGENSLMSPWQSSSLR
jgi:hypothetical protein